MTYQQWLAQQRNRSAVPGPGSPGAGGAQGGGGVIDLLTTNWEGGSNARYDVSQMQRNPDGTYSYGGYTFDSEGRPLSAGVPGDGPGQWVDGKPGARGGTGPGGVSGGTGGSSLGAGMTSSDPYFNQLRSLLQSQSIADLANTKSAIQKALIGFGLVPEGFKDQLGVLDDVTRSLISKNTESGISYYARLLEQKKDNLRALIGRLSRTGLRRSGAKGYKMRQGQLDFDRLFQDSLSELLGQTGNMYSSYANNEYQRQVQLLQALMNSSFAGGGGGGGGPSGPARITAPYDPNSFPATTRYYNPIPPPSQSFTPSGSSIWPKFSGSSVMGR